MADKKVKVVNNTNTDVGIVLTGAPGYLSLTQFIKGKTTHISQPIDLDVLPESVVKKGGMAARGEVSIINA